MKKVIFTILAVLVLTSLSFSQNKRVVGEYDNLTPKFEKADYQIKDFDPIAFQNQNKLKVNTEKGILYRTRVFNLDDGKRRYTFTYDENGNMLKELNESVNPYCANSQYTYTYNAIGNMLTKLYELDKYGALKFFNRSTYTYDPNGKILTEVKENFFDPDWKNGSRISYTYDANGNITMMLREIWSEYDWYSTSRTTYTYDESGNKLTELLENYRNNGWEGYQRYTYSYTPNGNILTKQQEYFKNGTWRNNYNYKYLYQSEPNQVVQLFGWWNPATNDYDYFERTIKIYDVNNRCIEENEEVFYMNNWLKQDGVHYTYTEDGNILTIVYLWEGYNENRLVYTYDSYNNCVEKTNYIWQNDSWVNNYRFVFTYDLENNIKSINGQNWNSNLWVNMTNADFSSMNYSFLFNNDKDSVSFSLYNCTVEYATITNIKEELNNSLVFSLNQNYPNPFNPSTNINFTLPNSEFVTLKIYDILGKEVTTLINEELNAGSHTKIWDAKNLSSGVYFYKLTAGKFNETKKMILVR